MTINNRERCKWVSDEDLELFQTQFSVYFWGEGKKEATPMAEASGDCLSSHFGRFPKFSRANR